MKQIEKVLRKIEYKSISQKTVILGFEFPANHHFGYCGHMIATLDKVKQNELK